MREPSPVPSTVDAAEEYERIEDAYWERRASAVLAKNEPSVSWEQALIELESIEDQI